MGGLGCCLWWLLLGLLLGWLANWLLSRRLRKAPAQVRESRPSVAAAAPAPIKFDARAQPPAKPVATIDFDLARRYGFAPEHADDLTVIEGIGPKTDALLRGAGIASFAALADAPLERLRAILVAAGPNFRVANPGTWAEQAALAANNRWEALRALQDRLLGGIEPSDES